MPIKVLRPALVENPATFTTLRATSVLSIPGFEDVSASLAAAKGGIPTLQQVTDQGSSTTTSITASIISASGDIITNALTASGLNYPSADGVDGQVIVTDGAGNLSFGHGEKLHIQVRNDDSITIPAGTPIYSTGEIGASERIKVRIASASDDSKMPAIGIVETTLTTTGATQDGFAIINGIYNTNITPVSGTPALGDNIYVHADGGVTTIKPSGSNLIQNIGTVLKTNGTIIQGMKVSSIDRTNDVPNLLDNTIFFGSGSDQTQQIHISGALDQTIINNITASGNISASNIVFGITGSFSHVVGNSPITVGDSITFQQPVTASTNVSSSARITAKEAFADITNISNPRGDGFMGGGDVENVNVDIVFLTHQDFHLIDLATAGENVDNIAAQRSTARSSNLFSNGASSDNRFASYVIPCGFKVTKVGVIGTEGTFNVRATSIAAASQQNCFPEGAAQSITTSPPADTFAGYLGMATALGGEAAIIPSASLAGGLGNYININVIGTAAVYGGVIVLERI